MKFHRYVPVETRFWARVQKTDGCWLWLGKPDDKGYGHIRFNAKGMGAHVYSYRLHKGDIPKGLFVCHKCDNPICVRPDHLFLGTNQDNTADRTRKGRSATGDRNASRLYPERRPRGETHHWQTKPETRMRGEANGRAKLTDEDVREMRHLWATGDYTKTQLARKYGVTDVLVFKIVTNQLWTHVQ